MNRVTLLACMAGCLAVPIPFATAQVFEPMTTDSAMTLGSGVIRGLTPVILPGCFKFDEAKPDPQTVGSYIASVKAFSSLEEVIRERNKSGSASASYGGVKAAVEGWSKTVSSDKRSALFVVLEAKYTGPRTFIDNLRPKEHVEALFKTGTASQIRNRCGTHIASIEHHGQIMRIVINLSQEEQYLKQAVAAKFAVKGGFGTFKAKASGSYSDSLAKLASSKTLDAHAEGTGQPPSAEQILDLFKTNAGDLNAIADKLGEILKRASVGKVEAQAIYGYTVQPVAQFDHRATGYDDSASSLAALEQMKEFSGILSAQIASGTRKLAIIGIAASDRQAISARLAVDRSLLKNLREDISTCPEQDSASENACEAIAQNWEQRLIAVRGTAAALNADKKSNDDIEFNVRIDSKYGAAAMLVVGVNGVDYGLDPLRFFPGITTVTLVRTSKTAMSAAGSLIPRPVPQVQMPLVTELPLTLQLAGILRALSATESDLSDLQEIQLGCNGVAAYGPNTQMISGPVSMLKTTSSDSICATPQLGFVSPVIVVFPPVHFMLSHGKRYADLVPDLPGLMPPSINPLRIGFPKNPVSLKLSSVDEFGFHTTHLLSSDILADFQKVFD